jgi:Kef-type K+ transport system membrane component KefB
MINKKKAAYWLGVVLAAAGIVAFVLIASGLGRASTTSSHRNSLGVVMYTINPNIYEAGSIVNYAIIGKSEGLVLRVQPLATYALYTDEILLCGVPADKIDGHENPMVLIYERQAHKLVDGLGCHELVHVRDIKAEKIQ